MAATEDGYAFLRLPCELLVEFLELREAVNLLNCSRALRFDRVVTATALEKTRYAQHFHQQCAADWWHLSPAWKTLAPSSALAAERVSDDDMDSDWDDDEDDDDEPSMHGAEIWADCHQNKGSAELTRWKETIRETPQWQHVSLLTMIDFMVRRLLPQSYISFKYASSVYMARPVIIRLHPPTEQFSACPGYDHVMHTNLDGRELRSPSALALVDKARSRTIVTEVVNKFSVALQAQDGKLSSLFGLHWENMCVDPTTGKMCCGACQLYADEVQKYQAKVAEMVSLWKAAVQKELPGWKAQGMHQMEIDRRTYEMREQMIPYSGFYTSNVARRHGDIIIRHICSYWMSLSHLPIKTLGLEDPAQLVAALSSDIRKQCHHFQRIKRGMMDAFPTVSRIRYELGEPSVYATMWHDQTVTELIAGVSASGFLCGMLYIEKGD